MSVYMTSQNIYKPPTQFYRVKPDCKTHTGVSGQIVAQHEQADNGYIYAGFVSKYSPLAMELRGWDTAQMN